MEKQLQMLYKRDSKMASWSKYLRIRCKRAITTTPSGERQGVATLDIKGYVPPSSLCFQSNTLGDLRVATLILRFSLLITCQNYHV